MTDKPDVAISGEANERRRQHRFYRLFAIAMLLGGAIGFVSASTEDGFGGAIPVIGFVVIALALTAFVSIKFFRSVDELEMADNLWSALYGLYFYMALVPAWHFLHLNRLVPPVDTWGVYIGTMAFALLTYGCRKIGHRIT